jgi:hypothetical protein
MPSLCRQVSLEQRTKYLNCLFKKNCYSARQQQQRNLFFSSRAHKCILVTKFEIELVGQVLLLQTFFVSRNLTDQGSNPLKVMANPRR